MKHLPLFALASGLLLLTGCQTTEQAEASKQAQLNAAYAGKPLSDFIFRNGLNPHDMFDMPNGERVFLFGPPCVSWWRTRKIGEAGTPAHFIVMSVEIRGYCP